MLRTSPGRSSDNHGYCVNRTTLVVSTRTVCAEGRPSPVARRGRGSSGRRLHALRLAPKRLDSAVRRAESNRQPRRADVPPATCVDRLVRCSSRCRSTGFAVSLSVDRPAGRLPFPSFGAVRKRIEAGEVLLRRPQNVAIENGVVVRLSGSASAARCATSLDDSWRANRPVSSVGPVDPGPGCRNRDRRAGPMAPPTSGSGV